MKNNTLLKVLSATAIFSALAAIEAYDHDDFAFAADENPIVATTTALLQLINLLLTMQLLVILLQLRMRTLNQQLNKM